MVAAEQESQEQLAHTACESQDEQKRPYLQISEISALIAAFDLRGIEKCCQH